MIVGGVGGGDPIQDVKSPGQNTEVKTSKATAAKLEPKETTVVSETTSAEKLNLILAVRAATQEAMGGGQKPEA